MYYDLKNIFHWWNSPTTIVTLHPNELVQDVIDEVGERQILGLELVQDAIDKVKVIR